MKFKGGYIYHARLNYNEAEIIKNALQVLLDSYNDEPELDMVWRKGQQAQHEITKLINEIKEGE